jgi:hypothetical protein
VVRVIILLLVAAPVSVWNTLAVTSSGSVPPARVLFGLALLVPGYLVGRRVDGARARAPRRAVLAHEAGLTG